MEITPKRVKIIEEEEEEEEEEDRISELQDCLLIDIISRLPTTKEAIRTVSSYCKLNPSGDISWQNLQSLYVANAYVDEGLIQNILSGSPLLETLALEYCHGFRRVDVTSRSVKKFMLSGYSGRKRVIEINAPYLVSLTIRHVVFMSEILLLNVTSLLKAELYYAKGPHTQPKRKLKVAEEEILEGLLLNLSHVKELKIGRSCKKALSRLEAKGFTLPKDMKYPDYVYLPFWKCL